MHSFSDRQRFANVGVPKRHPPKGHPQILLEFRLNFHELLRVLHLVARIDSRESGDSRESEFRVIQANRPDAP